MVKKLFSISDEVATKLSLEGNQSAFVDALLHVFFDLSPADPGRQELAAMMTSRLLDTLATDPPLPTMETQPEPVTLSPEPPHLKAANPGTDEPPALVESPTPLVEPPTVPALVGAAAEPCEHGVVPPAVCIDCI